MCSSTVLRVYKNLSESRTESILLKQQLQHKFSNSRHTANNVPQQKYEDDCLDIIRVSLWYQTRSNKKNVISLCVIFPARMRIEPSCVVVFPQSMMFA